MKIYKCDKCQKEVKNYNLITLTADTLQNEHFELCDKCFNLLKKFVKENDISIKEYNKRFKGGLK